MSNAKQSIARTPSAETDAHARKVREQQRAEHRAARVRVLREWFVIARNALNDGSSRAVAGVCALVARNVAQSATPIDAAAEAREAGFTVEFMDNVVRVSLSQENASGRGHA